MTNYIYEGQHIRLIEKHYIAWEKLYSALNLQIELDQLDMEFQMRIDCGQNTEAEIKKTWFMETFKRLNSRNKVQQSVNQRFGSTQKQTLQESLTDRSWAAPTLTRIK